MKTLLSKAKQSYLFNVSVNKLLFRSDSSKSLKVATDEPIKFSTSKAADYEAYDTFMSRNIRGIPKSQPYIIIGSLAVFMVYFFVLREENEFDELIYKPLEKSIEKPNFVFIEAKIQEYEKYGLDTKKLKTVVKGEKEN